MNKSKSKQLRPNLFILLKKSVLYGCGLLLLTLFLVSACKKDETGEGDGEVSPEESMAFKSFQIMNLASERMIEIGESMDIDPRQALYFTMLDLEDNKDVELVEFRDSTYLVITTTAGFSVTVGINEVEEDSLSVYRGSS